jgi:hypothetical protein
MTFLVRPFADGLERPAVQQIADKIVSLATSSSALERKIPTFGFIHSKLSNSFELQIDGQASILQNKPESVL